MKSPLLQSLFDEEERRPMTVSELTGRVKSVLERSFKSAWLVGEIVNFSEAASGHWYFTLRDSNAQIRAACYRGANARIKFKPFDGLEVRVSGKITVYEPKGEYQILVESLDPVGEGAMRVAFEQLKLKLEREGLFKPELKRPLPFFPRRIGVVTSPNGAAIHDILNVVARRTRTVDVLFVPCRVQGETAPREIRDAVELANELHFNALQSGDSDKLIDVLIVGRGGGSIEDLWAFNDERVARAIRNSLIPVISAVGHETDFTIADFVADYRAPTPSAAAEIVAAQESEIAAFLEERTADLAQAIEFQMLTAKSRFQTARSSQVFNEIPTRVLRERQKVESNLNRLQTIFKDQTQRAGRRFDTIRARFAPQILSARFVRAEARLAAERQKIEVQINTKIGDKNERFALAVSKLEALSPLAVLSRGYALAQKESGEIVQNAAQVKKDETLQIRVANGAFRCKVV